MTVVRRFLSASAAAWAKIILTIITQLLLVPLFLGHWPVEEYGAWLVIQTIVTLSTLLTTSHQSFVGYELLQVGDQRVDDFRTLLYSSIPWTFIVAAFELLVLVLLIVSGVLHPAFSGIDDAITMQAYWSLILYSLTTLLTNTFGGLAARALAPFGHFPRVNWWNAALAFVSAAASAVAVVAGCNLLQTVACTTGAMVTLNVLIHRDIWRLYKRHHLHPVKANWQLGIRNVVNSLAIAVTTLLDLFRAQGVRLLLSSQIGLTGMTAFSTMRTMSNVSLQGIGTVTNPVMPEMMRFLGVRDADRVNAVLGFVWFFVVMLLSPVLIAFQWIMPAVFHYWTRGKVTYDPIVFGLFSVSLLVFAVARPLAAVLQGNNLLKVQLGISVINSLLAIAGIASLTASFGLPGAALSLLVAEVVATILTTMYAERWLRRAEIAFAWELFCVAIASIVVAIASIFSMVWLPLHATAILIGSISINAALMVIYFVNLPPLARNQLRSLLRRR